jgi:predicted homoserine dehydrogenase-like protein
VIIVDRALRARADAGKPIRVGMVGAGFMGRGIANQIVNSVPGMALVAIANRSLAGARRAYDEAGCTAIVEVETPSQLEDAVARGTPAITENPSAICRAGTIDAVIEVTGAVEHGARVAMEAIENRKHVIGMAAELHGTLGAILKVHADRAGVVFTDADGDQPGVEMNLYRFVRSIGLTPLVCGNIKGLQDPYRTPATQEAFARRWGQSREKVTSFADGTKIAFEQAIVANATGMRVAKRGMLQIDHTGRHVDELTTRFDAEQLRAWGGIVDFVVGAKPGPGVFILATHDDPRQRHYLDLYKLGEGPLYSFYTPYHLCHFEVPLTVARAVLFGDAAIAPVGAPGVEVITLAKRDLRAGEVLDGIGGYTCYGQADNADVVRAERLLPMGLADGCRLTRDLSRDAAISYDDVVVPSGRYADRLRAEQDSAFSDGRAPRSIGVTV